jgi:hypothetical protein
MIAPDSLRHLISLGKNPTGRRAIGSGELLALPKILEPPRQITER